MKPHGLVVLAALAAFSLRATAQPKDAQPPARQKDAPVRRADKDVQDALDGLLVDIQESNYERFAARFDTQNKEHLTKPVFDLIVSQVAPALKTGYQVDYLGYLNQRSTRTHLWKLVFKKADNEVLVRFRWVEGKISGFGLDG